MRTRLNIACVVTIILQLTGCQQDLPQKQPEIANSTDQAESFSEPSDEPREQPISETHASGLRFDLAEESGIDFLYYGSPSPERYMTEQNGGGVALLDYDRDGALDIAFANGSHFEHPAESAQATYQLYRRTSAPGDELRYASVAASSGLKLAGFGMGLAAADYNNDGFVDLLVCEYGRILLWENLGDGTWFNVTDEAGLANSAWAAGAAWGDLDEDGNLDLYVTNYVQYSPTDPPCFTQHTTPVKISCGPIGRTPQADVLWKNTGDGHFADHSEASGILQTDSGKGLAVELVDLDGDDRLDIYVANDTTQNFLFQNQGNLRFEEVGVLNGVAFGPDGKASSSMGTACADFDRNQRFDLFVTNFENSVNDYYRNHADQVFFHASAYLGLDATSRPMLAFGTVAADFNLDQWPDIFVANGHIWDLRELGFGHQYEMTPQLFLNQQGKRFVDVSRQAGSYLQQLWLGRAATAGDLDDDGDADLVVSNQLKKAAVVVNRSERKGGSMLLNCIGRKATRAPLGIRVTCRIGEETFQYHLPAGGSFAATLDPRVQLSTGSAQLIDEITVHWQSQGLQTWLNVPVTREAFLVEGSNRVHQLE